MNTLPCKPPFSVSGPKRLISSDIAFAASIAEEEAGMLEPALVAWTDGFDGASSPLEQCCPTPDSCREWTCLRTVGISPDPDMCVLIDSTELGFG